MQKPTEMITHHALENTWILLLITSTTQLAETLQITSWKKVE